MNLEKFFEKYLRNSAIVTIAIERTGEIIYDGVTVKNIPVEEATNFSVVSIEGIGSKEDIIIYVKDPLKHRISECNKKTVKRTHSISEKVSTTRCCICGGELDNEWGNDPWGAMDTNGNVIEWNDDDRCCDICNFRYVIAGRLKLMKKQKEQDS